MMRLRLLSYRGQLTLHTIEIARHGHSRCTRLSSSLVRPRRVNANTREGSDPRELERLAGGELSDHALRDRVAAVADDAGDLVDRRGTALGRAQEQLTTATDTADGSGRVPDDEMEIRDRPGDQRAHADHREAADREIVADHAAGSDRGAFAHERGQRVLVRLGRPELLQVWRRGPREPIVGEDGPGADHDTVLDRHRGAQVHERVDLDAVADVHVVRDVCLLADDALLADPRRAPDVDVVPDRRAGADLHAFLDDGGRVDARAHRAAPAMAASWPFDRTAFGTPRRTAVQCTRRRELYAASMASTEASASSAVISSISLPWMARAKLLIWLRNACTLS